jgi:hypothetical protein
MAGAGPGFTIFGQRREACENYCRWLEDSYRYLVESIAAFPTFRSALIGGAGFNANQSRANHGWFGRDT